MARGLATHLAVPAVRSSMDRDIPMLSAQDYPGYNGVRSILYMGRYLGYDYLGSFLKSVAEKDDVTLLKECSPEELGRYSMNTVDIIDP
jgi:hypothetical protein